jgi:hypothetical protein
MTHTDCIHSNLAETVHHTTENDFTVILQEDTSTTTLTVTHLSQ